ncbi:DMT family transporter [Candidatus Hepatincolaceae symbiont of Richtersius coronifer]
MTNPIILAFMAFAAFAFADVINRFLFIIINIEFFNYVLWLDLAILICLIIFGFFGTGFKFRFLKTNNYKYIVIRSALSVLNTFCSLLAVSYLPLHIFYILAFTQPLFAALFAIIFRLEKIKIRKILLIILGLLGMGITLEIWRFSNLNLHIIGVIGGLGIALTGSLSGIIVQYIPKENPITIASYSILLSLLIVLLYFGLTDAAMNVPADFNIIGLIFAAGLFISLGMIFFIRSYQRGQVQYISSLQYTQIIWGTIFGYLLFKEVPSLYAFIGIFIIILSNMGNVEKSKLIT